MAGFKHRKRSTFKYDFPWEMYADRKNRKIQSLYDHQTQMLKQYMDKASLKDISLELPTGSGKTLVGLLIGDFRRLKNGERVVYLCTNKVLVNQVCEAAKGLYGIDARPFVGSKRDFSESDKIAFSSANCIAVTTYSSLFNYSPFFKDAEILIFDDAHSAGSAVAECWSVRVEPTDEFNALFLSIVKALKPLLSKREFHRLSTGERAAGTENIVGFIPSPALERCHSELGKIFDDFIKENECSDISFPMRMIRNNLSGCSVFFTSDEILIRPLIPPTKSFSPMEGAKQRLYMSATIGRTGELERIFGRESIETLPPLDEWRDRTTGRRLFMFPRAIEQDPKPSKEDLLSLILTQKRRALIITDTLESQQGLLLLLKGGRKVFCASGLQQDKDVFLDTEDGVIISASRLEGMDFPDEQCRIEVIYRLPRGIDLQERFFISMVQARELYSERIRTRLTQALGRCTRGQTDYAVVYILDDSVKDEITAPERSKRYNYELQAEIEFALDNLDQDSLSDYLDLATIFLDDRDSWEDFEQDIVEGRTEIADKESTADRTIDEILKLAASKEVQISRSLWDGDYQAAICEIKSLINSFGDKEPLMGYGAFWNYVLYQCLCVCSAEQPTYEIDAKKAFSDAKEMAITSSWIIDRASDVKMPENENASIVKRLVDKIRRVIATEKKRAQSISEIDAISKELRELTGKEFESPHKALGSWLGYIADNPSGDGEPDPYWIIDSKCCIVAEDKIYESENKAIPIKHAREVAGHEKWIRKNLSREIDPDAVVETVFITNANSIEEGAAIHVEDVWYINRDDFLEWGIRALHAVREIVAMASRGNLNEIGALINQKLTDADVTSSDFLAFVRRKKLKNLKKR